MWVLGLVALGSVVVFETRVDDTRRAQVVIADLHNEQGAILAVAFSPALAGGRSTPSREVTAYSSPLLKRAYAASLAAFATSAMQRRTGASATCSARYFALIDRLCPARREGIEAAAARSSSRQERSSPAARRPPCTSELDDADSHFGAVCRSGRATSPPSATVRRDRLPAARVLDRTSLLASARGGAATSDAMTDALTGLGNRRKLFADMEGGFGALDRREPLAVGMFDLDGFKQYNDTFGHPAGDALLARLGTRLVAVVGDRGTAYRIGGDEFVIITPEDDGERALEAAQAALSERGAGFAVGCSRGSARILSGITLEQALHVADQRLYANKRSPPPARIR